MINDIQATTTLNNGVKMPWLGLGVFQVDEGREVKTAVLSALEAGYRSIDTAALYGNEVGVGEAIRESGIAREEIFVTTKVWNDAQRNGRTLDAFYDSQKRLDVGYVDLYLIHWPVSGKYVDTWRNMEKLLDKGLVRAVGVSNFQTRHLKDLFAVSDIVPVLNQVEQHPRLRQKELHDFCIKHNIQLESWSPLMRGQILGDLTLIEIGERHRKSAAQVILRWQLQHGIVTIPKSVTASRIRQNGDIFDFVLTDEEMAMIDGLDRHRRIGPDPDNFNF